MPKKSQGAGRTKLAKNNNNNNNNNHKQKHKQKQKQKKNNKNKPKKYQKKGRCYPTKAKKKIEKVPKGKKKWQKSKGKKDKIPDGNVGPSYLDYVSPRGDIIESPLYLPKVSSNITNKNTDPIEYDIDLDTDYVPKTKPPFKGPKVQVGMMETPQQYMMPMVPWLGQHFPKNSKHALGSLQKHADTIVFTRETLQLIKGRNKPLGKLLGYVGI